MPIFLPDSNCIVARLCTWQPRHFEARSELDRRLGRGEEMIVAGHSLVEAYSVMTRVPQPNRIPASAALNMIATSFVDGVRVISLDALAYVALLEDLAAQGIAGGAVYDAVIAACARLGGADTILTFNDRHFARFAGAGLEVVVPTIR